MAMVDSLLPPHSLLFHPLPVLRAVSCVLLRIDFAPLDDPELKQRANYGHFLSQEVHMHQVSQINGGRALPRHCFSLSSPSLECLHLMHINDL